MFNFKLITLPDGNQVIDSTLKTPYNSLTPDQMLEYMEVDSSIAIMQRMEKRRKADLVKKNALTYRLKEVLITILSDRRKVTA